MKEFESGKSSLSKALKEELLAAASLSASNMQMSKDALEQGEGIDKVASVYVGSSPPHGITSGSLQPPYTAPFLTLSDTKLPQTSIEIFKWCKYIFMFDPIISGAVTKLATFPITEIHLEDGEKDIADVGPGKDLKSDKLKIYEKFLFEVIKLRKLLIEIGIDYNLYGNCFVFGEMGVVDGEAGWKTMRRLPAERIIIDSDSVTGGVRYKWRVPRSVQQIVNAKSPKEEYDNIPDVIKEAVRKNEAVVLNPNRIYHFARPSDSGKESLFGVPLVANVLKLIMYRNTLRQAQEAVAKEHIVPFRIFCVEPSTNNAGNAMGDWGNVAKSLAQEITKTVRDPNYKVVSPYPIRLIEAGGNGRALLVTPEIDQVNKEILVGLGTPAEFLFGGVSYSGTSLSIKILENDFITYRLLLKDFIQNFVIKEMAKFRREWVSSKDDSKLITCYFQDLKMQDDVQQKQLMVNLNGANKISNEHLWRELDLDPSKMKMQLEQEAISAIELQVKVQLVQMEKMMEVQKLQIEQQVALQKYQRDLMIKNGLSPSPDMQQPLPGQEGDPSQGGDLGQQDSPPGQPPIPTEAPGPPQGIGGVPPEAGEAGAGEVMADQAVPPNNDALNDPSVMSAAMNILKLSDQERLIAYSKLPKQTAEKIHSAVKILESYGYGNKKDEGGNIDMRPYPEQKPPRRNSVK